MSAFRPKSPTVLMAMDKFATTMLRNWFDVLHREYFVVHLQNVGIINLDPTDILNVDELQHFVDKPYIEHAAENIFEAFVNMIKQLLSAPQDTFSIEFYWLCDVSLQSNADIQDILNRLKEIHIVLEHVDVGRLLNGVKIHSTLLFVGHKDVAQDKWNEFQLSLLDTDFVRQMSAILLTAQHNGRVYYSEQVQYEWMESLTFCVLEREVSRRQELSQMDLFPSRGDLYLWKLVLVQDLERRIQEMYKRRQATKIVEFLLNSNSEEELPIQSKRITNFLSLWSQRFDLSPDSPALNEDISNILYPYMKSIDTLESRFEQMQHELVTNHLCVSLEQTYLFDDSWTLGIYDHLQRLSNAFTQYEVISYLTMIREKSDLKVEDWTKDLHILHDIQGGIGLSPLLQHLLKEQHFVDKAYESNQVALSKFITKTSQKYPELTEKRVREELSSIQIQAQELWSSVPRLQTLKKLVYPLSPVLGALMTPILLTFVDQQGIPEPRSVLSLPMLRVLDNGDVFSIIEGLLTDPSEIITSLSALLLVPLHSVLFAWLSLSLGFYFALKGWVSIKTKQMQHKLMRFFGLNGIFSGRLQCLVYGINGKYIQQRQLLEMKLAEWISANVKRSNRGLSKYIDKITYTKMALEWLSEHGLSENDLFNSFDLDERLLPQYREGWSVHPSKYPSLKYLLPPLDSQTIHGRNVDKPNPLWILSPEDHEQVNRKVLYPHQFLSIIEERIDLEQLNLEENANFTGEVPFTSGIIYSNMSEYHFVGSILKRRWSKLSNLESKFSSFLSSQIHSMNHSQYDYHHIYITVERIYHRASPGVCK